MKSWSLKHGPHPQPLTEPGEQRREGDVEKEERDAAREWLRHVEAGRINPPTSVD